MVNPKEFENFAKGTDKSLLQIDRDKLDEECIVQPELVEVFGKRHAFARDRVESGKKTLAVLEATLYKNIRDSATLSNLKVTEEGVRQEIRRSKVYQEEEKTLRRLELEATIAWHDFEAIQQRGRSIDNLVRLFVAGYFSHQEGPAMKAARLESLEQKLAAVMEQEDRILAKEIGDAGE